MSCISAISLKIEIKISVAKKLASTNFGAKLNMSNNHGSTSLNTAVFKGYPTITQILIDGGAFINKPNLNQQTPLLVSCKQGHYPVAKLLIEGSCDLDWANTERKTPLIAAADQGHSRIVQLLVDAGLSNIHAFILFLFINLHLTCSCFYSFFIQKFKIQHFYLPIKMDTNKCVEILGADIDTCDTKNQSPIFGLTSPKLLSKLVNLLEESDMNMSEQTNMSTTDSQDTEIGDADQKQIEKENTMMFLSF